MRNHVCLSVFGRITAFAAVTLMLAAGCGSDSEAPPPGVAPGREPVTITFLRHENPNYVVADRAFFADYTAAHPEVTIRDTTVDFHTLASMLLGQLTKDQFPFDLVLLPPSWACGFADNVTDVPTDVITLAQAQEAIFAAPLSGSTCGGKLKAIPVEYNLEYGGVVVNVDKYEAKFGRSPSWPTWDAFIAEAAMLTEYDSNGRPMANGLDIDPDWSEASKHIFFSQILQRGGSYWTPTMEFDFSTREARDSLVAMVGWVTNDKVMYRHLIPARNTHVTTRLAAGATGYGWSDPAKPLAVMGYVGTAGVPSTVAQLPPTVKWRFDFFPLPPMVGNEHKFIQNAGWAFAVPNTSKNQRVAWDIARSLALSPEAMRKWSAVTGALPALKVNGSAAAATTNPTLAKVQPLLEKGQWLGYIPPNALEVAGGTIAGNFFDAATGVKSIEQALADMQRVANEAIVQAREE